MEKTEKTYRIYEVSTNAPGLQITTDGGFVKVNMDGETKKVYFVRDPPTTNAQR